MNSFSPKVSAAVLCSIVILTYVFTSSLSFSADEKEQTKDLTARVNSGETETLTSYYMEYPEAMTEAVGATWLPHIIVKSSIPVEKKIELLRFYVERGGDLDLRDKGGNTPLLVALSSALTVSAETAKVADYLIENRASLELQGENGVTFLHLLSIKNDERNSVLRLAENALKNAPLLINAPDAAGKTPLQYAVKGKSEKMVRWLLENGADSSIEDKTGDSAEDLAQFLSEEEDSTTDSHTSENVLKLIQTKNLLNGNLSLPR